MQKMFSCTISITMTFKLQVGEGDKPYKQFLVVKPHLSDDQCHPEEHLYPVVCEDFWKLHMTEDGRVEDVFELRKVFFFSNLSNIASFILFFFLNL